MAIGRTQGYLVEQLFVSANPFTIPLWVAGLWFYFVLPVGPALSPVGWLYVVPFALFLVAQGRSYYLAPAYPMLLAAGAVVGERSLGSLRPRGHGSCADSLGRRWRPARSLGGALMLPIAPVGSGLWS